MLVCYRLLLWVASMLLIVVCGYVVFNCCLAFVGWFFGCCLCVDVVCCVVACCSVFVVDWLSYVVVCCWCLLLIDVVCCRLFVVCC